MKESFRKLSGNISSLAGSTWAFMLAILGILAWAISGPYFHFSNTWLITVATLTDVIIFLMVFSLQHTQIRDSKAIQLKLNELIVADKQASNAFIGLESLTDDELAELDEEFKNLLGKLDAKPVLHKLHKKIREEKTTRYGLHRAGHLVGNLIESISGDK